MIRLKNNTTRGLRLAIFLGAVALSAHHVVAQATPDLAAEQDLLDDQALTAPAGERQHTTTAPARPRVDVAAVLFNAPSASLNAEARDRQFEQLAEQASFLDRQASVLREVVRLAGPSVVHIEAEKEHIPDAPAVTEHAHELAPEEIEPEGSYEWYDDYQPYDGFSVTPNSYVEEAGSGVIIRLDTKHYVLTNRHVIRDCELRGIRVKLADGRQFNPIATWEDPNTDVAVLQLDAEQLIPARLGNSNNVEIGDFVLAFGSPFGLSRSVTYGIISAKGRRDLVLGSDPVGIQDFLQTDAAINPGNSGGPLLNTRGEVIGLNTAIASNSGGNDGIGFSIPINIAIHVAQQLVSNGQLVRAYLGVRLDHSFRAAQACALGLPSLAGARVTGVTAGSPAESAGLRSR